MLLLQIVYFSNHRRGEEPAYLGGEVTDSFYAVQVGGAVSGSGIVHERVREVGVLCTTDTSHKNSD